MSFLEYDVNYTNLMMSLILIVTQKEKKSGKKWQCTLRIYGEMIHHTQELIRTAPYKLYCQLMVIFLPGCAIVLSY